MSNYDEFNIQLDQEIVVDEERAKKKDPLENNQAS